MLVIVQITKCCCPREPLKVHVTMTVDPVSLIDVAAVSWISLIKTHGQFNSIEQNAKVKGSMLTFHIVTADSYQN